METFQESFNAVFNTINEISANRKTLTDNVKALRRDMKVLYKSSAKKPTEKKEQPKMNLSRDLEKFLSVSQGTQMTKAEVMKGVSEYIKAKGLQIESNKRKFSPDTKMSKVFNIDKKNQFSFVEINKHVSSHLSKC
jgi:chromatin remodeling complex protein RSC6